MKFLKTSVIFFIFSSFLITARPESLFNLFINAEQAIEKLYCNVHGYEIDASDSENIVKCGGCPTYGEITFAAISTIIKDLPLNSQDVFYDLGSGVGKVCVQVALTTPIKKIVGVELSKKRHENALTIKNNILHQKLLQPHQKLIFLQQNILDTNLNDATVILICSTCFSDRLMIQLTHKLSKLQSGLQLLSLRKLPKNNRFKLVKTYQLPMSWSKKSNLFRYRLETHGKENVVLHTK